MKRIKERSKGIIKKKRMSFAIRLSVILLSVFTVFSILHLCSSIKSITAQYSDLMIRETKRTDTINSIESHLAEHQTYIFEHVLSTTDSEKNGLESKAQKDKKELMSEVQELRKEFKDTKYDIRYKSLASNVINYLMDSETVFSMSHNGQYDEMHEYMQDTLVDYINSVNDNVSSFKNLLQEDIQEARVDLESNTKAIYMHAIILLMVLIACSVFSLIISFRLSHEIINIDPLTQIPNFDCFLGYCDKPFMRRNLSNYAIMSIDIKGFQYFNQQLGTSFGDALLIEYASQLKKNKSRKRYHEYIARVNGDSFIALHKIDRIPVITDYLRQIDMNVRFKDSVQKVTVYSRCGVCPLEKGMSVMDAVENSRTALKEAKKLSSSSCVWYTPKMSEKEHSAKETIAKFSEAIKNKEFLVYYQPKVDMTTNKLCGCEALVRWMHDGKLIPPFSFIPILEDEGYITELDFYVFEKVCEDISVWVSKGIEPVRISSNFSKLHLKNKRFAEDVLETIAKYNVDKKYIEIELTESSGYDDFEAMTQFVNKMKLESIHTAIDDFGTGYSSLSLLKDLDIDVVKLDKSFLNGANTDLQKQMIENIIKMIRDLHHDVICEGVETEQQAQFLKSVKCFMAQGYLYDKPLPHDDFESRLVSPVYVLEKEDKS